VSSGVWTIPPAVIVTLVMVLAPAAAPDRKPPRIVGAAMLAVALLLA
jgi:hypothetical protein